MGDSDRRERGARVLEKVYAGLVQATPEGQMPFMDVMIEQLFGEIWSREALSIRDRRLLTMGVLAANGDGAKWGIQIDCALEAGELTAEQAREAVIHLASYAGYPKAADILPPTEAAIARHEAKEG